MTIDEIKELLQLFNESGVGELEVQRGDDRIRIKRAGANKEYIVAPTVAPLPVAVPPPAAPSITAPSAPPARPVENEGMLVKSPIVGTYYDSPSPDAPPFVRVGDSVEPGQVLCIIESMKLMNEIEAETGGTIAAKLVENGRPVEYGEALFSIRPR
jgi:acetyl-CoA carboxylase biotin carboxyl carrier protein